MTEPELTPEPKRQSNPPGGQVEQVNPNATELAALGIKASKHRHLVEVLHPPTKSPADQE